MTPNPTFIQLWGRASREGDADKHAFVNQDFADVERRVWAAIATTPERRAILARAFGAGEIEVAKQLGRYPVPHDQLDEIQRVLARIPGGWGI